MYVSIYIVLKLHLDVSIYVLAVVSECTAGSAIC